jgi:hypothetical protein
MRLRLYREPARTGRGVRGLGEADLTGTVTGSKLKFSFTGKAQGNEFTVTYDGEIEGDDTVRGTVDLAGMASGTFTGTRKKK